MKKNTKLLIGSAVCVGLLGAALSVVLMLPSESEQITTTDNNTILLYDKQDLYAEDITVKNSGGEYHLLGYDTSSMDAPFSKSSEEESSAESSEENVSASSGDETPGLLTESSVESSDESSESSDEITMVYTMQDYEDEALAKTLTDNLCKECRYMAATQIIDRSGSKYAEYGLEKPEATVSVIFSDNSEVKLYLGIEAPENKGVYMRMEGDKNVYLVNSSLVDMFFVEKLQMFDHTVTELIGEERTPTGLSIEGAGYKDSIRVELNNTKMNSGKYVMTLPYRISCNDSNVDSLFDSIYNITGKEIAAVGVKEQELASYGLDKPYQKITCTTSDRSSLTLIASQTDKDGICYVKNSKNNKVFKIDSAELEWYNIKKTDLMSETLLYDDLSAVKTAEIEAGEKTYTYVFNTTYKTNETYDDISITDITYNGKKIDYANFQNFYLAVQEIKRSTDIPKTMEGCEEILSLTLNFGTESTDNSDTLLLLRGNDGKTIAVLNGHIQCYTDSDYIDTLIAQVPTIPE